VPKRSIIEVSHEAVIYGVIVGAELRGSDDYCKLQFLNEQVIKSLPLDDDHPWVDASIFSLPGPHPIGTFRRQLIHFGLTIKENTSPLYINGEFWEWHYIWIQKFEVILRKLFWNSARLILESDFNPRRREFTWRPTDEGFRKMYEEPHIPIDEWDRVMRILDGDKLYGT
jgi:hypothetical protein